MTVAEAILEVLKEHPDDPEVALNIPIYREMENPEVAKIVQKFLVGAMSDPETENPLRICLGILLVGILVGRKLPEVVD